MGQTGRHSQPGMRSRQRFLDVFRVAFAGIRYMLRTQRNARIYLVIIVLVVALGAWLRLPAAHWALLVLTFSLVLAAEAGNSAIEILGDAITTEWHPLIGTAKDIAAGAVLIGAIGAIIIGFIILGPPLWQRLAP
ncbi:diacylglycerol kinase family protein [Candidatus Amarolinea dominans]|uniref:diacylglycerol kinase family protein n=1 Tax=Candidatus Amarolinea dominans TaxID=3140696 RepID=UPI0031CC38ED